jgi:DNA-binding PadR family transcriptional regulator
MGEPVRSSVNLAVLSIVLEQPGHGYDVGTRFVQRYAGLFDSTVPHIYKSLDALETEGHVESFRPRPSRSNPRPRSRRQPSRVYRATSAGARRWSVWLTGPIPADDARRELWIRLQSVPTDDHRKMLQLLDHYETAVAKSVDRRPECPRSPLIDVLVREDHEVWLDAQLRWVQSAREHVRHRAGTSPPPR